jgi:hypothetical protein
MSDTEIRATKQGSKWFSQESMAADSKETQDKEMAAAGAKAVPPSLSYLTGNAEACVERAVALALVAERDAQMEEDAPSVNGWSDDGLSDLSLGPRDPPVWSDEEYMSPYESTGMTDVDEPAAEEATVADEADEAMASIAWLRRGGVTDSEASAASVASSSSSDSDDDEDIAGMPFLPTAGFNAPRQVLRRELPTIFVANLHKFVAFYDVGIHHEATTSPKAQLYQRLQMFLEALFDADETATLYVVQGIERAEDDSVIDADNYKTLLVKPSLPRWRKFFNRISPWSRTAWQKVIVLMGHKEPFENIVAECASEWKKVSCFKKTLQCENSEEVGWAYRSHLHIDRAALEKEISRWCCFPVGLSWKGVKPYDPTKKHHALHFEVMEDEAMADRLLLCQLYHARKTANWPLFMKLHFVPTLENANPAAEDAVLELRNRQRMFTEGISHWPTTDFDDVDRWNPEIGKTLRAYIAEFSQLLVLN